MLTPTRPEGSEFRLIYEGPVGVAGAGVEQSLDLTLLPEYVRKSAFFRDSWRVFAQPLDDGVSQINPEVDFNSDNDLMLFTLDSNSVDAAVHIEAWFLVSPIR